MSTILGNPITLGGGGGNELIVTAPTGSTVTATKGSITKTATEKSGTWTFKGLEAGDWEIVATKGSDTKTITVTITNESAEIYYKPDFTYTGDWEWYNEEHTILKLKTSGTITFDSDFIADVFCVGGGGHGSPSTSSSSTTYYCGGGGGGGYTKTQQVAFTKGTPYAAIVGAGGTAADRYGGDAGGETSLNGVVAGGGIGGGRFGASGGTSDQVNYGGNGGSGGGGGGHSNGGAGGSDGSNGLPGHLGGRPSSSSPNYVGIGQGTTTRAFGESNGELFAGGGGAGSDWASNTYAGAGGDGGGGAGGYGSSTKDRIGKDGVENTGGGGGGASTTVRSSSTYAGGYGGSGVILVRFV